MCRSCHGAMKAITKNLNLKLKNLYKKTGFKPDDQRFIESCDINTSLSVLSRCICSIKNNNNSIPWREHILTKILYEYLTGIFC